MAFKTSKCEFRLREASLKKEIKESHIPNHFQLELLFVLRI